MTLSGRSYSFSFTAYERYAYNVSLSTRLVVQARHHALLENLLLSLPKEMEEGGGSMRSIPLSSAPLSEMRVSIFVQSVGLQCSVAKVG